MESSYITALETRAKWLHWGIREGQKMWMDRGSKYTSGFQSYLKVLQSGDTYFMNHRFCDLVSNARSTVPDDLQFESAWMLSPQGWMWLERPFPVPTILESKSLTDIKLSAIGWLHVPEGYPTADYMDQTRPGKIAGKGAYQFLCFLDYSHVIELRTGDKTYARGDEGFGTWSYFMIQDGDNLIDRINEFESKTAQMETGAAYAEGRSRNMLHEIRWIYSAMYLMAQRVPGKGLTTIIHHDTDRATKRRGIREGKPVENYIKVISLRRYEEEKKKAEAAGGHVDWQWQWFVRGHWRNQFYPSTGEYKPKFIEAFIKGPKDKPMKPESTTVFVARR